MPVSSQVSLIDDDAEEDLLSLALRNPVHVVDRLKRLRAGHMASVARGALWDMLVARVAVEQPTDLDTLESDLALSGILDPIGGTPTLRRLVSRPIFRSPETLESRLIDFWQRRQLVLLGHRAAADMEEVALWARGGDRQSAEMIARATVNKLAEWFTLAQGVCSPLPEWLSGRPSDVTSLVNLLNLEVRELAHSHDLIAEMEEKEGSAVNAAARRNRARQLREMVGEVHP